MANAWGKFLYAGGAIGLKAVLAFAINYLVVNKLSIEEFADWARLHSIFMMTSVLDFGLGQYLVTSFVQPNLKANEKDKIFQNALIVCLLFSLINIVVLYLIVPPIGVAASVLLSVSVGLRVATIPFGAILAANEQFHHRKIIDTVVYAAALPLVFIAALSNNAFTKILVVYNLCISAGGLATVLVSVLTNKISFRRVDTSIYIQKNILLKALPYFTQNISSLLCYGGFVWSMSLVFDTDSLAKIAVLHAVAFMNLYQLAEVALKVRQPFLLTEEGFRFYRNLFVKSGICLGLCWMIFAKLGLLLYAPHLKFTLIELTAFLFYTTIEVTWLFAVSTIQLRPEQSQLLASCSIIKSASFICVILTAKFIQTPELAFGFFVLGLSSAAILSYMCLSFKNIRPSARK